MLHHYFTQFSSINIGIIRTVRSNSPDRTLLSFLSDTCLDDWQYPIIDNQQTMLRKLRAIKPTIVPEHPLITVIERHIQIPMTLKPRPNGLRGFSKVLKINNIRT